MQFNGRGTNVKMHLSDAVTNQEEVMKEKKKKKLKFNLNVTILLIF